MRAGGADVDWHSHRDGNNNENDDDSDVQLEQQLRSEDARVMAMLRDELDEVVRAVRESLTSAQPSLQQAVEQLAQRAQHFYDGVDAWQHKAQAAVRAMQEQQRALNAMVHEAALHASTQRERMLREQDARTAATRETCLRLLREVDAAT